MKKILSFLMALSITVTMVAANISMTASAADVIKIACVGDSITAGTNEYNYPMYLQAMLGSGYEVKNFGKGGSAVRYAPESDGTYFWYGSSQYNDSLNYDADYVFVMMGTNDVRNDIDSYYDNDYYNYLIKPYLDNGSTVIIMTSPTAYSYLFADVNVINTTIRQHQIDLASRYGLRCIDMNTATKDMPECFPDGLHGNASGYMVIAQTVYREYFGGTTYKINVITEPDTYITLSGANTSYGAYVRNTDENTGKATIEVLPDTYDISFRKDGFLTATYNDISVSSDLSYTVEMQSGNYVVSTGKSVTATGSNVSYINDADEATLWVSSEGTNQDVIIDLGSVKEKLTEVRLSWGGAYASSYEIQLSSDGSNWSTVGSESVGATGIKEIRFNENKSARYVKLVLKSYGTKYSYYELYEMEVISSQKTNPVGGLNLAVNCAMSADSLYSGTTAEAAVDGDITSYWRSNATGEDANNAAWLRVDLGAQTIVDSAIIRWTDSSATTNGYVIQYSTDGKTWTDVSSQTVSREDRVDTCRFDAVTTRYIRAYITAVDAKVVYPSIYEFEIYNSEYNDTHEQTVNFALSGSAFDGGTGNYSSENTAAAAIDGDISTGWQATGSVSNGNIYLAVDLGKTMTVGSVNIRWEETTRSAKGGYVVQYSNDAYNWSAVQGTEYTYGPTGDTVYFDSVSARYIRVLCNTATDSKYCPKINELEIYRGYSSQESKLVAQNVYADTAEELTLNIIEDYYSMDTHILKGDLGSNDGSFVWAFGSYVEALADTYVFHPDNQTIKNAYIDALDNGFARFRVQSDLSTPAGNFSNVVYYNASAGNSGDYYYDDNAWVAIQYLNAYEILDDKKYLTKAEEILNFFETGIDSTLGGGLYWDKSYSCKNTCADGPAAICYLWAYKLTGNEHYLNRGKELISWLNSTLRDSDGLYFDNKGTDGSLNTWKAFYNQGTPLYALCMLYDITGEAQYKTLADQTAQAILDYGFSGSGDDVKINGNPIYKSWCVGWLIRGFEQYVLTTGEKTEFYDKMESVLDDTLATKNSDGYYDPYFCTGEWGGESTTDSLQPCGVASVYALCAYYDAFIEPYV